MGKLGTVIIPAPPEELVKQQRNFSLRKCIMFY